ncbi:hypothetical protein GGI05_005394 [Coemansia sp. RSA 2603]|nr:hypothetical protein GGI05_005394 [Coemansia sp. RSA 2603]
MSLNLDQQTTYSLSVGSSLQPDDTSDARHFHLVSRQLPRTTTKLSREILDNGTGLRTRLPTPASTSSSHLVLEGDSADGKSSCTYDGDYELLNSDEREPDVECVLIYDAENNAFVVERLASAVVVRAGALSANATSVGLALPAKTHVAGLEDDEDALAKELEGMLDDDFTDPPAPPPPMDKPAQARHTPDDRLNMELEETLERALMDVPSDDDDFEEVDAAQFAPSISQASAAAAAATLSDDDMAFEEVVLPTSTRASPATRARPMSDDPGSDEFEDFEDVGSPRTALSSTFDDALFGESIASTPVTGESVDRLPPVSASKSESVDEFDDLDFDLARNIEHS